MTKVLLFGATGNLGRAIAKEAKQQGYAVTAVIRHETKAVQLANVVTDFLVADVTDRNALVDICQGYEVAISALGKSVSPNDKSKPSFHEIDFLANSCILEEAFKSKVRKFVYVSAFHAEKYPHLEYFRAHHDFSEKLKQSGLNYAIIKPPALFSAFTDMIQMAEKGRLLNIGPGDKKTNPIYEGDLARICVNAIKTDKVIIEAGGKHIYTRAQLNGLIQLEVNPAGKVRTVPMGIFKFLLPLIKIFDRNTYDKFAFFLAVLQHDIIAPPLGEMPFEAYIRNKVNEQPANRQAVL